MRILLASTPHRDTFGYSMPPPGLLRLGGWLERAGHDVALEDLAHRLAAGALPGDDRLADAACELLLARGRCDVLGLSAMGATLPAALAILERVSARAPDVALLLGGPATTGVDRQLVERAPFLDAVVRGEGEVTLAEYLAARARGAGADGIAGLTRRGADGRAVREEDRAPIADLGDLAPPAWHLLPAIAEYKRITGAADGLVPIDSGRGCVYDCSFCTIGRFWSRRSRTLPARRLADEVAALRAMPAARSAYLCHDLFGAHRGHALAFCAEMERRGAPVPWEARARADHLDAELLARMGRAGCYRVLLGIESGDARVRELCNKSMRASIDLPEVIDGCLEAGITPILSLILGLPGEGEPELRASLDLCADAALRGGVHVSLHLVNPQPGCGLGDDWGDTARALDGIPPDMALGAGETAPERAWIAAHPDLFTTFALLPLPETRLRGLAAIARELPEVLHRYPRTFALLRRLRGVDALDLYAAWQASARNFESFARAERDALADDVLALEQAQVRAAAPPAGPARGPRARGVSVRARHDVPRILDALRAGAPLERSERETWLVVAPAATGRALAGTRTLRVSAGVARVLADLDGRRGPTELEAAHPGIGPALARLCAAGLVEDGVGAEPRSVQA